MTRLRRHWALAAVLALFLCVGAFALDDYLPYNDVPEQRAVGAAALDYLAGDGERAFDQLIGPADEYYGAVFEVPLVLVERILGLEDSRDIHLSRHFLTHLFFLAGGGFCYLLALRLFNNRLLALVAMALFLLHPRMYAHSFFNSKDVPFLVAFMIALYLTHRAFRRETLGAFLLCGAGIGLLVNLRVMGIVLLAAVLVPRALDAAFARDGEERGRALLTGGAFALAAVLTYYASLPVLWTDPIGRFADLIETLGSHPTALYNLFLGEWLYSPEGPPWNYVPVWAGITTPPATLLLALAGAVALAWRGARRPLDVLRNTPSRFGFLLIALPVATVAAVVALENNVHTTWQYFFFLYAPLVLLAVAGLHWLAGAAGGRWMRAGAYALTGTAIAVTVVSMARIHQQENNYFNALVDRTAPERLLSRHHMDWKIQVPVGDIARDHPAGRVFVRNVPAWLLGADDRERFIDTLDFRSGERNFYQPRDYQACPAPVPAGSYVVRLYGAVLSCVVDPVAWFGELRRRALATEPLDRSRFAVHRVGDLMVYVRDGCEVSDLETRAFIHARPVDRGAARYGWHRHYFALERYGARIDGNCVAVVHLPNYPIASISTDQHTADWAGAVRRAVADVEPAARARFAVWLEGQTLTYVREECTEEDAAARFFLHVYPEDVGDLAAWRKEDGFDNLDFDFRQSGAFTEDGGCALVARLPDYPIASIRTGQFDATGQRWAVEFAPSR